MKIALLGYGKMNQLIASMAKDAGHEIVLTVDEHNRDNLTATQLSAADVAIDFTRPEAAVANIRLAVEAGVPVVVGTTGWLGELETITKEVNAAQGTLFWASNFSVGVNVFFAAAARAAQLINQYGGYDVRVEETHHTQKLDAPSGTGITLAERVGDQLDAYSSWALAEVRSPVPQASIAPAASPDPDKTPIPITSVRKAGVPGTHLLTFSSAVDSLELKHTAHSREGFARGALTAAGWVVGRNGVFTMSDLLGM
ncbi:4-hydroxy-tetrahydrodipicolinate reductase [Neolewinella persica]|uniref:4-hydroxy-tetrahydrodipicolinate reductase n=1 Tax=Neolewinella persica TaxID=70998 RepID=UPI0003734296|nr:4-hydroxy-tetrahydrodipicolinate reductase [Neolewinella persica]